MPDQVNPFVSPAVTGELPAALFRWDDDGITMEFEIVQADLLKLGRGHTKCHPQWRQTYFKGWLRLTAIIAIVAVALWWVTGSLAAAVPALIAAAAFGIGYPLLHRYRIKKGVEAIVSHGRNLGLLGGRRMHFNPRGMYTHTEAGEFLYYWPSIELIAEYQGSIHVYVTANSAMIIPDRAFDSGDQRQEFLSPPY